MGSRNHEIVPTTLVATIAGLKSGNAHRVLGSLARTNLVSKEQNAKCKDIYFLLNWVYGILGINSQFL